MVHCDIEEAETQENEKLQHALREMELQFQETKATLIQETQENERLQHALREMELQFQETNSTLIQKREATNKEAEKTPTIQDFSVNVVDNELINKLTAENEKLKVSIVNNFLLDDLFHCILLKYLNTTMRLQVLLTIFSIS